MCTGVMSQVKEQVRNKFGDSEEKRGERSTRNRVIVRLKTALVTLEQEEPGSGLTSGATLVVSLWSRKFS